ncbi:hypothetical protein AJ80_02038 [Polytolypa hystricis UAMH7299]|uniref:Cytochrome P450 n=1 Tax=Polytolypa hystricis (strain UAMH7299) TaxID=1447883 RepID=A0A2B7YQM3_POLH7|nr:hypothetical protein AJ80_02038 [Polytolypa hystricis UAMH7299]
MSQKYIVQSARRFPPGSLARCQPNDGDMFPRARGPDEAIKLMSLLLGEEAILSTNGPAWKRLHSIFAPAFAPAHLRTLIDVIIDEVLIYRQNLVRYAKSGTAFSVEKENVSLTFNVIGNTVMNNPFRTKEGMEFMDDFRIATEYLINPQSINPISSVMRRWLRWRKAQKIDRYVKNALIKRFNALRNESTADIKKSKSIMDLVLWEQLKSTDGAMSDANFIQMALSK